MASKAERERAWDKIVEGLRLALCNICVTKVELSEAPEVSDLCKRCQKKLMKMFTVEGLEP
jgi:hypothetical protein